MTANKDFKRFVRSRARATGRSYTATLRHLRRGDAKSPKENSTMKIFGTIPDIRSLDLTRSHQFYCDLLGFDLLLEQAGMLMFGQKGQTGQQITVNGDAAQNPALPPGFTIDVGWPDEVERLFVQAQEVGHTIIEPMHDKAMGVRRFSIIDPDGNRVTVLAHTDLAQQPAR